MVQGARFSDGSVAECCLGFGCLGERFRVSLSGLVAALFIGKLGLMPALRQ